MIQADQGTATMSEHECQSLADRDSDDTDATGASGLFCHVIWDGLMCWPRTQAGELLTAPCPNATMGVNQPAWASAEELASKMCTENGTWFQNRRTNNTVWTNYSLCTTLLDSYGVTTEPTASDEHLIATELLKRWFPIVKAVSQVGYGVSLVTLVVAIFVLTANKKLRCPRNTLHMHLFASFILRASMALLKDSLFIQGVGLSSDVTMDQGLVKFNHHYNWECKVVISVWQYSILANYSWILMEGLYLHSLVFHALFSDTCAITRYIALGWGLPAVCVAPWILARAQLEDTLCWTTHDNTRVYMLIKVPIVAAVLLSFALFINIVRVLLLKLRASGHSLLERRHVRYRRWAKSTLILVPLFGVHYAVFLGMSYYVDLDQSVEIVWLFCDQLFGSFQGCLVALLYCLLNTEVRYEVSRKWHSWRRRGEQSRAGSLSSAGLAMQGQLPYTHHPQAIYHVGDMGGGTQAPGPAVQTSKL